MAPPRAVKKSSLTTISQTTSRQGPQQSRRQVVEEVEEVDDFYDANSMDLDSENEVEAEPEASQSAANGQLEHLMAKMVDDQRKRYASKKKGVGEAYNRNCMTAQESINTLFDYHEQEA
ncbi:hypothetical protein EJ02DRAFT_454005 [Clathrospora elynae]|uniref:Uncharacterized protein n=1 Tax=Clathrospora elynae TaxID=706981 RepID=A0A6A5SSW7_9PLEO|nr:hypothetical protein EJ02DRAFT_454005 [Clathrospora elynae]